MREIKILEGIAASDGLFLIHERILFVLGDGAAQKHHADEEINPADDQVHGERKAQLHQIERAEAIEEKTERQDERAGQQRGGGELPGGAKIKGAVAVER